MNVTFFEDLQKLNFIAISINLKISIYAYLRLIASYEPNYEEKKNISV